MAKRRMVSQSIWTNRSFIRLNSTQKLLFIGLVTIADDEGRLWNDELSIKAKVFPVDNIKMNQIIEGLEKMTEFGLIVKNAKTIQLTGWNEHQTIRSDRVTPSVIPSINDSCQPSGTQMAPNGQSNIIEDNIIKDNIREGNIKAEFSVFWEEYPKGRKSNKVKMLSKWKDACKEITADELLTALKTQKKLLWDDPKYIPLMATWLNQKRWELDPEAEDVKELTYKGGLNGN